MGNLERIGHLDYADMHQVMHATDVAVPAEDVLRLLAETGNWTWIFPSVVDIVHEDAPEAEDRLRIVEATAGGPRSRTIRRVVEPDTWQMHFEDLTCAAPFAGLGGVWTIERHGAGASRVRLEHKFAASGTGQAGVERARAEAREKGRSELAALKTNVEFAHATQEATFSFEDSVLVNGTAEDAYAFINDAHLWADRLPHVHTVHLTEETPGLQTLVMDTQAKDGSIHTTKSYRVTTPHHRISYKQITLPALLDHHTGTWTFHPTPHGVTVTSQHTVTIKTTNITNILGPRATLDDARKYVHTALSTNSQATLDHAKNHTENRQHP
ncbi:SRPBCC family protein [Streptomyces sp. H27-C3]|uniref:SRPBCC family protein n=1 Tax=Streptomyces sp. H27-C3 TaxID=3046305 RepID=UPI0024B8D817|nr:SRPBCC family protein [Streptomyces sp. H27-C3]MDJ0466262.1 SRPBCC family protein [Streptomyces sp. H27-C3]